MRETGGIAVSLKGRERIEMEGEGEGQREGDIERVPQGKE
jgi:hypothetical protein